MALDVVKGFLEDQQELAALFRVKLDPVHLFGHPKLPSDTLVRPAGRRRIPGSGRQGCRGQRAADQWPRRSPASMPTDRAPNRQFRSTTARLPPAGASCNRLTTSLRIAIREGPRRCRRGGRRRCVSAPARARAAGRGGSETWNRQAALRALPQALRTTSAARPAARS